MFKRMVWMALGIVCIVLMYKLISPYFTAKTEESSHNENSETVPVNESNTVGELSFKQKNGKELEQIYIELADSEEERNRGLMNRHHLPDSVGMLFVFDTSEPQSFWMKNTFIPLDIIFANENKEIVKIHSYATPHSIDAFPSGKNAKYVVEVNGGFAERNNIKEGDVIDFKLE